MDQTPHASLVGDPALRWDVFCRVIDNHGDLGVCWRLARELAGRGHRVRLWVDEPDALAWMAPQGCAGVELQPWRAETLAQDLAALPAEPERAVGDVVVEAFGCDPPDAFVARMAARRPAPVWINLEYLSAQDYVERSHRLASPQWRGPGAGLTKWFFYPGFTPGTGGLLREPGLYAERVTWQAVQKPPALTGGACADGVRRALLFCYDNPALPDWLTQRAAGPIPWLVEATPGHAARQVEAWCHVHLADVPEGVWPRLAVQQLDHVSQPEFDRLLWRADLNFVRGEDSLVRALWAGRPFVWQIYPQQDGAHIDKLEAFLSRYLDGAAAPLGAVLREVFLDWNALSAPGSAAGRQAWVQALGPLWPAWQDWSVHRSEGWARSASLIEQLLEFVAQRVAQCRAG